MNADGRVLAIFVWMAALLLVNWLLILLLWWVWGDCVKGLGAGHMQGGGRVIVLWGCVRKNYTTCSRKYLLPILPVVIFCIHKSRPLPLL